MLPKKATKFVCLNFFSGGLNFKSESCNIWQDTASCNSKKVFRNQDPSQGFEWFEFGEMANPRSRHYSIVVQNEEGTEFKLKSKSFILNGRTVYRIAKVNFCQKSV